MKRAQRQAQVIEEIQVKTMLMTIAVVEVVRLPVPFRFRVLIRLQCL